MAKHESSCRRCFIINDNLLPSSHKSVLWRGQIRFSISPPAEKPIFALGHGVQIAERLSHAWWAYFGYLTTAGCFATAGEKVDFFVFDVPLFCFPECLLRPVLNKSSFWGTLTFPGGTTHTQSSFKFRSTWCFGSTAGDCGLRQDNVDGIWHFFCKSNIIKTALRTKEQNRPRRSTLLVGKFQATLWPEIGT